MTIIDGLRALFSAFFPGRRMITFACPSCSRSYTVSRENANKRTRCTQCRVPLVVPEVLDLGQEDLHDRDTQPDIPQATLVSPCPDAMPSEPAAYQSAEWHSAFLAGTVRVVGFIAGGFCLVGSLIALAQKSSGWVALGCLVCAGVFGLSVVTAELAHQLVLVFLDHARNGRAITQHLTRRNY